MQGSGFRVSGLGLGSRASVFVMQYRSPNSIVVVGICMVWGSWFRGLSTSAVILKNQTERVWKLQLNNGSYRPV